jgi:hypothetical protein
MMEQKLLSRLNTCQNRDAARRRMLDYAARASPSNLLSASLSMSNSTTPTVPWMTSSLTTEQHNNASDNGLESEITETEGEDEDDMHLRRRHHPLNYYENGIAYCTKAQKP